MFYHFFFQLSHCKTPLDVILKRVTLLLQQQFENAFFALLLLIQEVYHIMHVYLHER